MDSGAPAPSAPATTPAAPHVGESTTAPATAPAAAQEPTQTWWQALLYDVIFKLVVPILIPVLSVLVFWLLRKMGLKVELETLDGIADKAATYAEKKGAAYLREKGVKSDGAKKEEWAWEFVDQVDAKLKGVERIKAKLRGMILAKIPEAEAKVAAAEATKPKVG